MKKNFAIGIDIGSVAAKGVLFDGEKIINKIIVPTGWSPKKIGKELVDTLKIDQNTSYKIAVTGYGRVSFENADKIITEISCHGKGAYFMNNNIRTVLDIGGQDSKVITLNNDGTIDDFIMNDKCAAGTGKFLEASCNTLGVDIADICDNLDKNKYKPITSMCTVFAESEIISLLAEDTPKEEILVGILRSIASRIVNLSKKLNIKGDIVLSGGLSNIPVLIEIIEEKLDKKVITFNDSQLLGAIGAAISL